MDTILGYAWDICIAIVIFYVGKWIVRQVTDLAVKILRKNDKFDQTLISFFENIIYYVLLIVVILTALEQVGVETTSFLAILGAAGLAIGLALKDSLSNFASGVMIVFFKPFKVGDFVEAGGESGFITGVNLFNTEFKTGDNQKILVPNSAILSGSITNANAHEKRRIDLVIGVSYDDNIKQVKEILTSIISTHEKVLQEEANRVSVSELADSSVNFIVHAWVNTSDYLDTKFDLLENIKIKFDEAGVTIPYPQSDVHIYKQEAK